MSLELHELVALARSSRSTSITLRPRPAASRAMPAPLMPPPTTRRSTRDGAGVVLMDGWPCGSGEAFHHKGHKGQKEKRRKPIECELVAKLHEVTKRLHPFAFPS